MDSKIEKKELTEELRESYLDYAMSVIVGRALPDARDGLKPVHRRILWAMWDSGLSHSAKLRKSANVVGEVLGRYHPHGDMAVYDSLARMAQNFSLRYPLIEGQGNWGSIDGDSPAAMRYCVTGDTLVITDKGLLPIEDVSPERKKNTNIKILSKDRIINNSTKWFDSGEHETIKIKTNHGFVLQGSKNHPILIWTKNPITGEPSFRWKLLEDIEEGDIAVLDRSQDVLWPEKKCQLNSYSPDHSKRRTEKKVLPKQLNENLAYILGALVAEGTIAKNEIEFCNSDKNWVDDFEKKWKSVFPDCRLHRFSRKPSSFGKKPYETLEIHSRYVVDFLRNIGLHPDKSAAKKIPWSIFRSPKKVVASFLKAYFEGDGSISKSGKMIELSCISVSERLVSEIQTLLLRFGILSTKRFDSYRDTYKLYLRGFSNYSLFKEEIGFISERKNRRLRFIINALQKNYSATDFVPFVAEYVRANTRGNYKERSFAAKHNFDRYANMEDNYGTVLTAIRPNATIKINSLFEYLLRNNYVFDSIVSIENGGVQKVYSVRVDSDCHSFIGNGFINHNTECRLSKIAEELLADIEKETVDFADNYDGTRKEPKVLPAKIPNLLINGSDGIAVGMATKIPPHNLTEVLDASIYLIEHPGATSEDLMQYIQGPDFPTGGIIYNKKEIMEAYASGHGRIVVRALAEIDERKIIISEIPYQVNKSELLIKIAELVQEKRLEGIKDVRDESDKDGLRIAIDLKADAIAQKILNQLYNSTDLQKDYHMNLLALTDGLKPRIMSIKDVLADFIAHREQVIRKRTEFDLKKAKERAHILEGLAKALAVIDKIIATIKKSADKEEAHKNLVKKFQLSDLQATAILEMRLQTLAALEQQRIEDELKEKKKLIAELALLLKSAEKISKVVSDEFKDVKAKFGDKRRTKLQLSGVKEFKVEDLVPQEETIITMSRDGYIRRLPPATFKVQRRGGKGLIGTDIGETDILAHFMKAKTHDNILFFTSKGRVFQTKVYEIPVGSRTSKGKAIQNFLELPSDEKVSAVITYDSVKKSTEGYLAMATIKGVIKKTSLADFGNVRRSGLIAIKLKKGDELKWVKLSSGRDEMILTTKFGQAIHFKESVVRAMGRTAGGVRAVSLRKDDLVSSFNVVSADKISGTNFLVVMANGYAKLTPLKDYKVQNRGGRGILTAKVTSKTGDVVSSHLITDEKELLAISERGQILKTELKSIRQTGRAAQGVRIMRLKTGDKIAGTVCL